jgi:hypothetical protein
MSQSGLEKLGAHQKARQLFDVVALRREGQGAKAEGD